MFNRVLRCRLTAETFLFGDSFSLFMRGILFFVKSVDLEFT